MKKKTAMYFRNFITLILGLVFVANSAQAIVIPIEPITNPTPIPVIQLPSTDPTIYNLKVSQTPFEVGKSPLTLSYDYKNFESTGQSFTTSIYNKNNPNQDLSKNFYDSNELGVIVKGISPKEGTRDIKWYGMASPQSFVEPGTYIFKVSGKSKNIIVEPLTLEFEVTNQNNVKPMRIYNASVSSNPYNPGQGSLTFNYSLDGISANKLVNVSVIVGKMQSQSQLDPHIYFVAKQLSLANGNHSFTWNGKDINTNLVTPDGDYVFVLSANNGDLSFGNTQVSFKVDSTKNSVQNPSQPNPNNDDGNTNNNSPSNSDQNPLSSENCVGFKDIKAKDPNCSTIYTWVKNKGIFTGNGEGNFDPTGFVTRDVVVKIVLEATGKFKSGQKYCKVNPFTDVTESSWSREYVCLGAQTAVKGGTYLVTGYKSGALKGLFLPGNQVTRAEFLAFVVRSLDAITDAGAKSYKDVILNQWYSGYASYAAKYLSSIYPLPNLNVGSHVTRFEAARVFYELHLQGKM